eukprot:Em0004g1098a
MLLQLYKVKRSHHGWNPAQNDRYAKAKEELLAAMTSTSFSTLERFPQRKMVLGEAQPVFLHDLLKQLLEQAAMSALRQTRTQEETLLRLSGISVVDGLARYCQTLQRNIVNIVNYVKAAVKLSIIDKQQGRVLDFTTSPVPVIVARQKRPTTVLDQHHYLNQNHCRQYGSRAREESKGLLVRCQQVGPPVWIVASTSGREKAAFSPGPGWRLFQFTRMPFGLCGAPSTFQRLMDVVMRGLPFVTTYIDDVLIHSVHEELHKSHLEQAFQCLREAGLTLRGSKCQIGVAQLTYLGHTFSREGMSPDSSKASKLTQKDTPFQWTQESAESFQRLKASLTETPVLAYPRFDKRASTIVQMDASNVGLGAVLEQNQQMIGYASCTLTKAVVNYNMNQRECLAIVWAMKQFRHYLLRRPFQLMTDHAPCNGLEFSFETVYRKGTTNGNTDALLCRSGPQIETRHAALTTVHAGFTAEKIRQAQQQDDTIQQLYSALHSEQHFPHRNWKQPPLRIEYIVIGVQYHCMHVAKNITVFTTALGPCPSYDDCSPSYDDCSPSYDDCSPSYDDCSPSYDDCSPSYDDCSPSYDDCSPSYDDCSPSYDDCSPSYDDCSPSYDDCSPSYDDCSPSYDDCSPSYDDCSPSYDDCSPSYDDCSPSYDDCSPSYDDCSPSYDDCSPSYDDCSPSYDDCSPSYDDCSPSYDDCSPSYDDCSPSYDDCCPSYDDYSPLYDDCSPS